MPRNSSGTYSLPEAPFVPNTPISSTAVNSDFDDIGDALTDSLSRSGDGGMTSELELDPSGFFYTGDTDTGMKRTGANTQVIECGGVNTVLVNNTGVSVTGNLGVSGTILVGGSPLIPVGLGPLQWSGTTAPPLWVFAGATYSRTTYAALWAFAQTEIGAGNTFYTNGDGSTTFTIGTMDGYVPAGVDAAAVRIAGITHVGDTAGASTHTLIAGEIPSITSSVTGSVTSANILTADSPTTSFSTGSSGATVWRAFSNGSTQTIVASVGISGTGTSSNTGGGAFSIVQPVRAFKYIIFAGV